MREKKFTPGPWVMDRAVDVYTDGKETFAVYYHPEPGHTVEVVETPDVYGDECVHGENMDQVEANANLIAAAPELLEALESVAATLHDYIGYADQIDMAESAIKKAYGETE